MPDGFLAIRDCRCIARLSLVIQKPYDCIPSSCLRGANCFRLDNVVESNQTRITTRGVHPHELEAIMSTDRTLELLERVFELPPGSLSPADAIADRWESIAVLGFMAAVDEEFSVVLSPQKLAACQTAQDVADLVRGHAS